MRNLIDELAEIFARFNIPFEGSLGIRAKENTGRIEHRISRYLLRNNANWCSEYLPVKLNCTVTGFEGGLLQIVLANH